MADGGFKLAPERAAEIIAQLADGTFWTTPLSAEDWGMVLTNRSEPPEPGLMATPLTAEEREEFGRLLPDSLVMRLEGILRERDALAAQLAEALGRLEALLAAVRLEHGPTSTCARRPQPGRGFLGACNLCARLAAFDALGWPDPTPGDGGGA
jgi:transposase